MQRVKRFFTAAGASLRAAAAFLVTAVRGVVAFFAKVGDTYKGYVNFPELVAVVLTALAAGGSAEAVVKALAEHAGSILTNVDPSQVGHWATVLTAVAGLLHRFGSGAKIARPSVRQGNVRTH